MKVGYQFITPLILGVLSTFINATDNSTISNYNEISAATLAQMTEEYNSDFDNKEAILIVSKAALSTNSTNQKGTLESTAIVESKDDYDKEIHSGDDSKMDESLDNEKQNKIEVELVRTDLIEEDGDDQLVNVDDIVILNSDSDSSSDSNIIDNRDEDELNKVMIKNAEDQRKIENTILGMRAMPDNATFWELFKAQIQADFAPFLIIIPRPIKKLIQKNALIVGKKLQIAIQGPLTPFVVVTGKIFKLLGNSIVYVGEDVIKFASFLSSFDDTEFRQKLRQESQETVIQSTSTDDELLNEPNEIDLLCNSNNIDQDEEMYEDDKELNDISTEDRNRVDGDGDQSLGEERSVIIDAAAKIGIADGTEEILSNNKGENEIIDDTVVDAEVEDIVTSKEAVDIDGIEKILHTNDKKEGEIMIEMVDGAEMESELISNEAIDVVNI